MNGVKQSTEAVNGRKTKEMHIGVAQLKAPPPLVILNRVPVERESPHSSYLGCTLLATSSGWTNHTEASSTKAAWRLYFLKQLKRAGAGLNDLLSFYTALLYAQCLSSFAQSGILV